VKTQGFESDGLLSASPFLHQRASGGQLQRCLRTAIEREQYGGKCASAECSLCHRSLRIRASKSFHCGHILTGEQDSFGAVPGRGAVQGRQPALTFCYCGVPVAALSCVGRGNTPSAGEALRGTTKNVFIAVIKEENKHRSL
jgi:hypothetical protein